MTPYVIYCTESHGYEAPLAIVYALSEVDALKKYQAQADDPFDPDYIGAIEIEVIP